MLSLWSFPFLSYPPIHLLLSKPLCLVWHRTENRARFLCQAVGKGVRFQLNSCLSSLYLKLSTSNIWKQKHSSPEALTFLVVTRVWWHLYTPRSLPRWEICLGYIFSCDVGQHCPLEAEPRTLKPLSLSLKNSCHEAWEQQVSHSPWIQMTQVWSLAPHMAPLSPPRVIPEPEQE